MDADGQQIYLSAGRNAATVTVTAEDGSTTATYRISVNRGVAVDFGWKAVDDLDGLKAAGNDSPRGIWSDGATTWVADPTDDKLYAYNTDGTRDRSNDFNTLDGAGNNFPTGIWSDGTTMWVADWTDSKIYAYQVSDKTRDSSNDFNMLDTAYNNSPIGIWSDRTTMWVADFADDKLYAYRMSDKTRDSSNDFNMLDAASNNFPRGIWSDGTTMWVADDSDNKLYAYRMSDKASDSSKDFNALSAAGNDFPYGIWSDGATMWVTDYSDDKVYSYNMPEVVVSPEVTVMFGQGSYTVAEGGTQSVTVTLSADPERTVTIPITATGQGGATSADHSGVPASVAFDSGQTSQSFTFTATQDIDNDDGESVRLTFGALPDRVSEGTTDETTVSITDDDIASPSASTNFHATSADRRVTLTWDDPQNSAITGYEYRVSFDGGSTWNPDWTAIPGSTASTTSHTVSGLNNGVEYQFEVRVLQSALQSAAARARATPMGPPTVPLMPSNLGAQGKDGALLIAWDTRTEDPRAPVTSYDVRYRVYGSSARWQDVSRTGVDTSALQLIEGLTNRRAYEVQVAAVNSVGRGQWANGSGVPQPVQSPPEDPADVAPARFSLGRLAALWVNGYPGTGPHPDRDDLNLIRNSCMGDTGFVVFWSVPVEKPVEHQAHFITWWGAGEFRSQFRTERVVPIAGNPITEVKVLHGVVNIHKDSTLNVRVRARYDDEGWGPWSPPVGLYCFDSEPTSGGTQQQQERQQGQQSELQNSPASGGPGIIGTPAVGETLVATTYRISDEDGLSKAFFAYQWVRHEPVEQTDADIPGETAQTYTVTSDDEAKGLRLRVTFTDDAGNQESLTSNAFLTAPPVQDPAGASDEPPANSPAIGSPTITGTARVGETLTADASDIEDPDGMDDAAFTFRWMAGGNDIAGATAASHILAADEEGLAITVRVSFTDDAGNQESLTSTATTTVAPQPTPLTASVQNAPASHDGQSAFTFEFRFSEEFPISYRTLQDHAFTVTGGVVTGASRLDKPNNLRWQIRVEPDSDSDVTVALPPTTDCDHQGAVCTIGGKMLSGRVEFTVTGPQQQQNPPDQQEAQSPPTSAPTITGTAQVGETLTADTTGIADADGLENATFTYQWIAGGVGH